MTSAERLRALSFSSSQLGPAMDALIELVHGGPIAALPPPPDRASLDAAGAWIDRVARVGGLLATRWDLGLSDLEALFRAGAPALAVMSVAGEDRWFVLLACRPRAVVLATPAGPRRVSRKSLTRWIDALDVYQEAASHAAYGALPLGARRVLLREHLRDAFAVAWTVDWDARAPFSHQLRAAKVAEGATIATLGSLVGTAASVGAWFTLGDASLSGRLDVGRIVAWLLITLTGFAIQVAVGLNVVGVAVKTAVLVRRRVLEGVMRMPIGEVRAGGVGAMLGRLQELRSVETGLLAVLLGGLGFVIDVAFALWAMWMGSAGALHAGALVLAFAAVGVLGWRYAEAFATDLRQRVSLTNDFVERVLGHRTRLAQQLPEDWYSDDDRELATYADTRARVDRLSIAIETLPRAWFVGAVLLSLPGLFAPDASLVLIVATLLLGMRAVSRVSSLALTYGRVRSAWDGIGPIFRAGARGPVGVSPLRSSPQEPTEIVHLREVRYRYPGTERLVLDGASLEVRREHRLLVSGRSGEGKSTLASIVSGLRRPTAGVVLLHGYDHDVLTDEDFPALIAGAPQFHENHIFSDTLAFNLLIHKWPATPREIDEARSLCVELGLGPLLARMPAEMEQPVGDDGWQLSHGERSRVFVARALLQGADVVVLDEAFGALDPETLITCMRCVIERAKALIVIEHT